MLIQTMRRTMAAIAHCMFTSEMPVIRCLISFLCLPLALAAAGFSQPDPKNHPDIFLWTDTCNVYVIKDGETALLIDVGDGSVVGHLKDIGVTSVEWVLFTHHHREQTQGAAKINRSSTKVAAPELERALFERPTGFRKMQVRLGDAYTIHGASYVRPPIESIRLDRGLNSMETFTWRGREFRCVDTRGNSPGSISYMLKENGRWIGFTGDLMVDGARMHTWFDTEWDYGFAAGVWAIANSAAQIEGYDASLLFPSHGSVIRNPSEQLAAYQQKLFKFERLYIRGYPVNSFASAIQDRTSRPTDVPNVWAVSTNLFKFRATGFFPNFYLIRSASGRGLVIDCGLMSTEFLDRALEGMRDKLGVRVIDAIIPTHMHGDHFLQAPHLREKWGAQIWALDRMAAVCERPQDFDYAAPIQAYGTGVEGVRFDRLFKPGEILKWEEYSFTIDWMPGQTEFALCVTGMIDGRKVAFTGDNIFGDPRDPEQNGHEAMVAHNSAIPDEGYIYGAEYLSRLKPDILLGGHSYVMDRPAELIERYRRWAYAMRDAFRELNSEDDYRYWFDPFWVRAEPYRSSVKIGESRELTVHLRNFLKTPELRIIQIAAPPGLRVEPAIIKTNLPPESRIPVTIRLIADATATAGVNIIAFDITRGEKRYGQRFDAIVELTK